MAGPESHEGTEPQSAGEPRVGRELSARSGHLDGVEDLTAPSEAFQTLASEVRVAVLVRLLAAERAGETPMAFSELQTATDVDTSAGFAYHLRQLADHFVEETTDGYVLTRAGRRAAEAILDGTFTDGDTGSRAS